MIVCLFRHGIAHDRLAPDCPPDAERALTPKGVRRTRRSALGLRAMGLLPDLILTSPYRRAVETAEIARAMLGLGDTRVHETDSLLFDAEPERLFDDLTHQTAGVNARTEHVVCTGHAPQLDVFLAAAVGATRTFTHLKKAGAAAIEFETPRPGTGRLLWLLGARALRSLGRDVGT